MTSSAFDRTPEVTVAILEAISDCYRLEDGTSAIDVVTTRGALVVALSVFIDLDPNVRSQKDIREMVVVMMNALKLRTKELRETYKGTGYRPWPAEVIKVN